MLNLCFRAIFGGSKSRYLEESGIGRCLHRGKFFSGVFAMHTPTFISIAACLREDVASVRSHLEEGGDFYPT